MNNSIRDRILAATSVEEIRKLEREAAAADFMSVNTQTKIRAAARKRVKELNENNRNRADK